MNAHSSVRPGQVCLYLGAIAAATPLALGGELPTTMSFADQSGRITEVVPEQMGNEKVVDAGDFDRDGDLDVVISNMSNSNPRLNKLYRNDGGDFLEVSGTSIIPGFSDADRSFSADFAYLDDDDWLDILIVNNFGGDFPEDGVKLYINKQVDGQFSHFEDESLLRLPDLGLVPGSRAAIVFDADNDQDYDFFVATIGQDYLFFNDGLGFFENVTLTNLPSDDAHAIDVVAGDLNADGNIDLLISNRSPSESMMYYNGLPAGPGGPAGMVPGVFGATVGLPGGEIESALVGDHLAPASGVAGNTGIDFYRGNLNPRNEDAVYRNLGNDGSNIAQFSSSILPQQVSSQPSCKPSAADLNQDGRKEIIITAYLQRPVILRNTSVGDQISFVDWTPRPAFPPGVQLSAWDVEVFDTGNDGDLDIFLGGSDHDHLFEQVSVPGVDEVDLTQTVLDAIFNGVPLAIVGRAGTGEPDLFTLTNVGENGFVSVVVNGPDDYNLEVLDGGSQVLGASNRGGLGVEEALQVDATGEVSIKVEILAAVEDPAAAADTNDDDMVDVLDLVAVILSWGPCPPGACPADVDGSSSVDVADLVQTILFWGPVITENDYVLEVLSRN